MKHIKLFESEGEIEIVLNLGDFITLKSLKSKPIRNQYYHSADDPTGEYAYFTKARDIEIYINNELTGALTIDERGFNTIHENNNFNFPYGIKIKYFYLKDANKKVMKYLIDCHTKMKLSNPKYGTYGIDGKRNGEGRIPLLTHNFFEYVKNDFQHSKYLTKMIKELPMKLDAEKYNL